MVVARLAKFYFKNGKRVEGFEELDLILNKYGRSAKGFQGFISLFSCDQESVAAILTTWNDEESFSGSEELFSLAVEKVMPFLEKKPDVEHYRVDTVNFSGSSLPPL
jgi:quinol monooxygenase YgiN